MTTTTKKRIDLSAKSEPVQRLAALVTKIKDETGSMEKLGRTLDLTGAAIQKWCEGNVEDVLAIQVGNLKKLADYLGWSVDGLLQYLEHGSIPQIEEKPSFSISTLSFEAKLALNLELAKSLIPTQEKNLAIELSDKERLRLGKLFEASAAKRGMLMAAIASQTGLGIAKIEALANADEDLEIEMEDLNKIAPYCFRPTWDNNRPLLSDTPLKSGEELLAAIRNGNGAKAR
ncbi:hypothetical protein [Floridanema evergladense]|uniref:HTH cro/C1-type domain-containing protein n=1 Tax=Floridaenema evergladense BLCC-F167 TaxID=3153639 RepID=A0ABV4WCW0_9CYAN